MTRNPSLPPTCLAVALALLTPGVLFTLPGCAKNQNPVDQLIAELKPTTPTEASQMLFDLADPDRRRRGVSLLSAAPFGGEGPYLRAYRLLIDDPDATVRAAAAKAIGLHGEVQDAELLVRRIGDESQIVRWECAKALQKIHNPIAVRPLIERMMARQRDGQFIEQDPDVRMATARALGQYAQPEVFNALVAALDDPEYAVVHAAERSLTLLTGQDLGPDGRDWLAWAEEHRDGLFAMRQEYVWQPYVKPRGFLDKAQFWKEYRPPAARPPRGLDDQGEDATQEGS
jgi:hypothetical protein